VNRGGVTREGDPLARVNVCRLLRGRWAARPKSEMGRTRVAARWRAREARGGAKNRVSFNIKDE
jgi:hypothetical protein